MVLGTELYGKTFGTIGFGRIGSMACERAQQFGMQTIAYDPYKKDEEFKIKNTKRVSLINLLGKADFISLSLPLTHETSGLLGQKELGYVKKGSYLIQASRGGIVDEEALIYFLKKGRIAGAFIDVFNNEPNFRAEFLKLKSVFLTPHYACSAYESRKRSGMIVAKDVLNFLAGQTPQHLIP
jgi:D-3-phosphoglycerate dehydrogenase